jgi:hypothetical protein
MPNVPSCLSFKKALLQYFRGHRIAELVVFGAIGAIEIAAVREVQTAMQRFSVEETLTRFQNVIAGKFATDFVEELHATNRKDSV